MAFFPRLIANDFVPMIRLLDDYALQATQRSTSVFGPTFIHRHRPSFQPKFDISENQDAYELNGELPGIAQKDINIEFLDAQTLSIKGRAEKVYEQGSRPGVETAQADAAIEAPEKEDASVVSDSSYQRPSVEDEDGTPASTVAADSVAAAPVEAPTSKALKAEGSRYWLSERSVGEFSRTFSFSRRVDHENVKASLKNGILSIVVPKVAPPTPRRIQVE